VLSIPRARSSFLLIAGSVLIPAMLFAAIAWIDYRATTARARDYVIVATNALAEQTGQALQTADLILARTLDRVDGMSWPAISGSRQVHEFLAGIVAETPLVQSVFLVDPQGYNSASSRAFPMPAYDNRLREYFTAAKGGEERLYVTAAFAGKMTGLPGFTVSRPRLTDGHFDGVVAVTLSPAYFRSFYEKIALASEQATAVLARTDGRLLARYPDIAGVGRLPDSGPLLNAAKSGAEAGVFAGASRLDGLFKVGAFRRIDGQPLLASFALPETDYLRQWYTHLVWMGGFAAVTAAALLWTSSVALRRAAVEKAHLRRLLQESERRKEAEQALQHLQKMEALGRLSGGVAHDFNNLLAAIIGALELARLRLNDPSRLGHLLTTAMQAAERGARLTAQMLAFSRNQDISPQPLDINAIICESEGLIQRTVDTLIEVSFSLDDGLWPAIGDRVQFEVALLNLAGNARDAMPLGGKLVFMTRNIALGEGEVSAVPAGDYVQISVTDTGGGMIEEVRARAFDPFFTTKPIGKGTGLGLSQVYGFADQLGGTATIRSAVGEGTTVTIWLPRAQPLEACAEPVSPEATSASARLKILLVDDDQPLRSLAEEILGELGHDAVVAENGPAALARLSGEAEFDLLLVDFAMPVMNGAEVAAEALKRRPELAILFMTGYAENGVLSSWVELGYRTLNKPFSAAALDLAIRQSVPPRSPPNNVIPLPRARS
jgi:signal transduction histidine kinase/CheY-like chemotaxis protein